jgi:hypothetical protein
MIESKKMIDSEIESKIIENKREINPDVAVPKFAVICKHCGKQIDKVKLIGLSLICPLCGLPQNGRPHMKRKTVPLKI